MAGIRTDESGRNLGPKPERRESMSASWRERRKGNGGLAGPVPQGSVPAAVLAVVLAAALVVGWAGCGLFDSPVPKDLREIQDDRHRIENPSPKNALATGRGCAYSRREAMETARKVARFNLRSLTGDETYKVRFRLVSEKPEKGRVCVEMSARARP